MRAAVLNRPGEVEVVERPTPEPGPHEVLVRVRAVGVCGSDTHYYDHGRIGRFVVEAPLVLGHESAGVIEAVGERVDPARIGQRVSIEPGVPCRRCTQCLAGRYNLCPDMVFYATPPVDGSLAELAVIDEAFAHPVPDSVSDEAAALLEPLSVGIWACRKGGVGPGSRVLVTGAGPIGIVAAQVARASGAAEVVVADFNPTASPRPPRWARAGPSTRRRPPWSRRMPGGRVPRCSSSARVTPGRRPTESAPSRRRGSLCSSAWAATSCPCRCRWCRSVS